MINEELLIHFLTRNCTNEELLEIENWISTDQANADWLFGMEHVWSLKDELRYSDRKEIETAYRRFVRTVQPVATSGLSSSDEKIKPAGFKKPNHALVFLNLMKYAAGIAIICLLAANIYLGFRNKSSDEMATNTIEVPVGQRVFITLSDGSKVWLNSGSILSYPSKFDRKSRTVTLDGEGYFEVTADKEVPFMVNTSMLDVTVLGTKFNVQAYPDEDISVSLLEGQLNVQADKQSVLLEANELAIWSKKSGLIHHQNKKLQSAMKWTSGELMFVDEPLSDIAKVLERRFGVTIVFDAPELADEPFTCHTQPEPTLEQVLNLLKITRKMNYIIREQTVHIIKGIEN